MSRTDDIINVAGHRLSTGAIEEVLSEHQSVAECAVIGIKDQLKGQLPVGLIALKAGVTKDNKTISLIKSSFLSALGMPNIVQFDRLNKASDIQKFVFNLHQRFLPDTVRFWIFG